MQQLRKALELTRQQSQYRDRLNEIAQTSKQDLTTIAYTQTRRIPVDAEVLRANRIIDAHSMDPVTDSYKMLRTQVLQKLDLNNWNSLAVVSLHTDSGNTLTAINLAVSLACEVNHTVLLVDLNLRKPGVCNHFEIQPELGIDDYLNKQVAVQHLLINPGIERLVLLPCKAAVSNSSEHLSSPQLLALIEELKNRYPKRLLIFDLPPLLYSDDAMVFLPNVDSTLLVVKEGRTKKEEILRARTLLANTPILGWVMNQATGRSVFI